MTSWTERGHRNGVYLREAGSGPPIVVLPGMEGSGESCLHLVMPVVAAEGDAPLGRMILVDYAHERHRFLGELTTTIAELLTETLDETDPVVWWGQSFGNLLLTQVCQKVDLVTRRTVLVSPFTGLPPARVRGSQLALSVTPQRLYTATAGPGGRLLFGPDPQDIGRPFFRALEQMRPTDVRRRVGWLAGQDFAGTFLALREPIGVWLGERDRLVDLPRQQAFFNALARRAGDRLTVLAGSGHVVLPAEAVDVARADIGDWLKA